MAFLPFPDRQHLIEQYRSLLRGSEGGFFVSVGVEPVDARPFLPPDDPRVPTADASARAGYVEMVRLLCQRRYRRRIRWVLCSRGGSVDDLVELDTRTRGLMEHLARLDLSFVRLEGPALGLALRSLGWTGGTVQ